MQTKACFRKEFLAFSRTYKLVILALVFIGLAVFNPLMLRGMGLLMDSLSGVYDEFGMDVSGMTAALSESVSTGVSTAVMELAQTGLIVFLLVINSNAGGEQKKRSVIIPRSAGLRSFSYLFPKYIIYPLTAFVLATAGAFAAWGAAAALFSVNDVTASSVLAAGALVGVCVMFYVCIHLTIGTATGKPGLSAAVCIGVSLLLPNIFSLMGSEYVYNPFTLNILAGSVVNRDMLSATSPLDVIITVLIALAIMIILFFVALFAQNAKAIDNSGNEIAI